MKSNRNRHPESDPSSQCRAKRANGPGMVYCLATEPRSCKHVGFFDNIALCLNPDREEIIARTKNPV